MRLYYHVKHARRTASTYTNITGQTLRILSDMKRRREGNVDKFVTNKGFQNKIRVFPPIQHLHASRKGITLVDTPSVEIIESDLRDSAQMGEIDLFCYEAMSPVTTLPPDLNSFRLEVSPRKILPNEAKKCPPLADVDTMKISPEEEFTDILAILQRSEATFVSMCEAVPCSHKIEVTKEELHSVRWFYHDVIFRMWSSYQALLRPAYMVLPFPQPDRCLRAHDDMERVQHRGRDTFVLAMQLAMRYVDMHTKLVKDNGQKLQRNLFIGAAAFSTALKFTGSSENESLDTALVLLFTKNAANYVLHTTQEWKNSKYINMTEMKESERLLLNTLEWNIGMTALDMMGAACQTLVPPPGCSKPCITQQLLRDDELRMLWNKLTTITILNDDVGTVTRFPEYDRLCRDLCTRVVYVKASSYLQHHCYSVSWRNIPSFLLALIIVDAAFSSCYPGHKAPWTVLQQDRFHDILLRMELFRSNVIVTAM